jgi:hypothetical protein
VSQDDLFGAPAGWYPDPLGLPQLRWWNNHAWTEQTSAARQPMVMQDTKFAWADDELPTRREERERERQRDDREPVATVAPTADTLRELEPPRAFTKIDEPEPFTATPAATEAPAAATDAPAASFADSLFDAPPAGAPAETVSADSLFNAPPVEDTSHVVNMTPSFGSLFDSSTPGASLLMGATENSLDNLFGTKTERRTARRATPLLTAESLGEMTATTHKSNARVSTGPAWIIAMIPLLQLVVSLLFLTAFGMGNNLMVFLAILIAPYFLVIALAFVDRRMLKAGGMQRPASWLWALLSAPVYLLARARSSIRETGHGIGPVLTWFGVGILHAAAVVAIPGLLIAVLPAVFSDQIEASVASDAFLISGSEWNISCPDTPPLLVSESVECKGIASNGGNYDITVSLERANGWIDWQVTDWGVFGASAK